MCVSLGLLNSQVYVLLDVASIRSGQMLMGVSVLMLMHGFMGLVGSAPRIRWRVSSLVCVMVPCRYSSLMLCCARTAHPTPNPTAKKPNACVMTATNSMTTAVHA